MKKIFLLFVTIICTTLVHAQKNQQILQWLKENKDSINLLKSEADSYGSTLKSIEFTEFHIIAYLKYGKPQYVSLAKLESAIISDDFLIVKEIKGKYLMKLNIPNSDLRQKFKDVFIRYSYSLYNTVEEDLPIYENDKLDKLAMVSEDEDGWIKYVFKRANPAPLYKYNVAPGEYMAEIQFVVTHEGKVKDIKKLGNNPKGIDEYILFIITRSHRWIPAKLNGKNVSSRVKVQTKVRFKALDIENVEDQMALAYYQQYEDISFNLYDYENKKNGKRTIPPIVILNK